MKVLGAIGTMEDVEEAGDTFAERAESYYQKRPQLLTLLQDLYNGYITLSDRYIQTLSKQKRHSRQSSQISTTDDNSYEQEQEGEADSDLESSLSYQQPHPMMMLLNNAMFDNVDAIVAELVIKNVEYDMLMHEVNLMERKYCESSRKIEIQKSLLEVLESERLVLLNENASLGYRVSALTEENKGLASESVFIKKKAGELAKCVVKMREDHRVYMLHKKIEDLQGQIHGLEKRNKEYCEKMLKGDNNKHEEDGCCSEKKSKNGGDGIALEIRFQMARLSRRFNWKDDNISEKNEENGKKSPSVWKRVKKMDFLMCGMNPTCA